VITAQNLDSILQNVTILFGSHQQEIEIFISRQWCAQQ